MPCAARSPASAGVTPRSRVSGTSAPRGDGASPAIGPGIGEKAGISGSGSAAMIGAGSGAGFGSGSGDASGGGGAGAGSCGALPSAASNWLSSLAMRRSFSASSVSL